MDEGRGGAAENFDGFEDDVGAAFEVQFFEDVAYVFLTVFSVTPRMLPTSALVMPWVTQMSTSASPSEIPRRSVNR